MSKPNILIIICDQLRYDALGCYGNKIIQTPAIDKLSSESVTFTNAYTSSPICVPARITMLTGRHDFTFNKPYGHKNTPHLSHILKSSGYHTAMIGKAHFVPCTETYGFDYFKLSDDHELGRVNADKYQKYLTEKELFEREHGLDGWDILWATSNLKEEDYVTTWNGNQTIEYLQKKRAKDKPFFCVCSFVKPHPPFDPPRPYDTMYKPEDMPFPKGCNEPVANKSRVIQKWHSAWEFDFCMREDRRARIVSHYYGNVSLIDKQIGHIISTLRDEGLYDDTIIIFLTDHGEQLGDQHLFMKHFGYDSSIHIPLILRVPGVKSKICDSFVSLTDILPTICDTVGAEKPKFSIGQNLISLYEGKTSSKDYMVSYSDVGGEWFSLQNNKWKYIYYFNGGDEELYDFSKESYETINLANEKEYKTIKDEMKNKLVCWIKEMRQVSEIDLRRFIDNDNLIVKPFREDIFSYFERRSLAHRIPKYLIR